VTIGVKGSWGDAFGQLMPSLSPTLDPTTAGGDSPTACLKQPLPSECDADIWTMDSSTLVGCVDFCQRTSDRCLTTGGKIGCAVYRSPEVIASTREDAERRREFERRLAMFPPPRRSVETVINQLKSDFAGGKKSWPKVDDRACTIPQMQYGGECTEAKKRKVFIRKDIWNEAQAAVRHLMAFRPNETGGDWYRWSDQVFRWISVGVVASNINPRFLFVTQEEMRTQRSEGWCNSAQLDSGDFPDGCPIFRPQRWLPKSIVDAFGLSGEPNSADYPKPAAVRFQFEGVNQVLDFKDNFKTVHPGSMTLPEKIQDRLLLERSKDTEKSLSAARDATWYWLHRRPVAAYEKVFRLYPDRPQYVAGFGTTYEKGPGPGPTDWGEGANTRVPGSGGYIRATELWAEWFTSQDLDELVGRVTLFWISNHLLYFAERGELETDPEALIEARDELLRGGFRNTAAIGASISEGLLGDVIGGVIGAVAGLWINLYLEIFNVTFGTPRCPESLFLRVITECRVEERLREQVRDSEAGGGDDGDDGNGDDTRFPFGLILGVGGAAVAAGLLVRSFRS